MRRFIPAVFIFLALVATAFTVTPCLLAQQDGDPVSIGTYRIVHSDVLGQDRRLLVHLPGDYAEGGRRYPVIYMLYGNHLYTYFAEVVYALNRVSGAGEIPPFILVAVENVDRYGDYLPVDREGNEGGARRFLEFMESELFPWVEGNYRTKPYRVIVGPQAGAPLSIYALTHRPGLFGAYIINNPFWPATSRDSIAESLKTYLAGEAGPKAFVHITYADSYWGDEAETEYMRNLEELLSANPHPELRVKIDYLKDNDDFIVPLGIMEGLKALFPGYRLSKEDIGKPLVFLEGYYRFMSDWYGFDMGIPDEQLVLTGDVLQQEGNAAEAERVFEYLLAQNPVSANALVRLANIYYGRGEKEKALEYFKRCLEILKDAQMIRDRVEQIEKELGLK